MQRKKGASFRDIFSFLRIHGCFYPAEKTVHITRHNPQQSAHWNVFARTRT